MFYYECKIYQHQKGIVATDGVNNGIRYSFYLTLLGAGGGGIRPPYHTFVIPPKKSMGKVANFFLLFLDI